MTNYRRSFVPGGSYFFTVNLADRNSHLLVERIDELREAFRRVKKTHPFVLDAVVVLPEHLHCIWTLPVSDHDYSMRWRLIKTHFSHTIQSDEIVSASRKARGERGIWQRRYWEHCLRDEPDFAAHVDYVHINPVRHGLVARACDWPHSSFHRYVKDGLLPQDWGGDQDVDRSFGERSA